MTTTTMEEVTMMSPKPPLPAAAVSSSSPPGNDDDPTTNLSQLISSSLNISLSQEIHKIPNHVEFVMPPTEKLYGLKLYSIDEDKAVTTEASSPQQLQQVGVPGFPDFPNCWSGQEGWAGWKKVKVGNDDDDDDESARNTNIGRLVGRYRRRVSRRKQLQRTPVNVLGIKKWKRDAATLPHHGAKGRHNWLKQQEKLPVSAKSHIRNRKMERRRKMVERLKLKRNIVDIQKGLESLSC